VEAVPGARQLIPGAVGGWVGEHVSGPAGALHAAEPARDRAVTWYDVDGPALAVGSSQGDDDVDARVAAAISIDVVRRRSGGGAVLMLPGEVVWVDLVVPAGDPLWDDDVSRSMWWVGDVWAEALASVGVIGLVHRRPMEPTQWSRRVCFSGVGPGEVVDPGGAKAVGISQRRTRQVARFQTMVHLRWRPELVAALVAAPRPRPEELAAAVVTIPATAPVLVAALHAALATR